MKHYSFDEMIDWVEQFCMKHSGNGMCDRPECKMETDPLRWIQHSCIADQIAEELYKSKDFAES